MKRFFNEDTPPIKLAWIDKDTFGLCHFVNEEITINVMLLIADTFIHELLHHRNPTWSERKVRNKTRDVIHSLTVKDIKEIAIYVIELGK